MDFIKMEKPVNVSNKDIILLQLNSLCEDVKKGGTVVYAHVRVKQILAPTRWKALLVPLFRDFNEDRNKCLKYLYNCYLQISVPQPRLKIKQRGKYRFETDDY